MCLACKAIRIHDNALHSQDPIVAETASGRMVVIDLVNRSLTSPNEDEESRRL